MVLTVAQINAFFTEPAQMDVPAATLLHINGEGIREPEDLVNFTDEEIDTVERSCRRPPGGVALQFGAQSGKRLKMAAKLVRFYELIGRPITAANIQWDPHMRAFKVAIDNLEAMKKLPMPDVPTLTGTTVMKWTRTFIANLEQCVGPRMVPLSYVIREESAVDAACPRLALEQPYSTEHGSVQADMIARASHTGEAYNIDNAAVFYKLEIATQGTSKNTTLDPYRRRKNGRDAFFALVSTHAGKDRWQQLITENEKILHDNKWKGNSSYTLAKHCEAHRTAFANIRQAAEHVPYEVPNEHTRITYLLRSIENSNPKLQAMIAAVEMSDDVDGIRYDFDKCVHKISPTDPVVLNRAGKRASAEISGATVSFSEDTKEGGGTTMKSGIGTTGVHLRYHVLSAYNKLSNDQKEELRQWRMTPEGKAATAAGIKKSKGKGSFKKVAKGGGAEGNKNQGKLIAAAVEKELKSRDDKKKTEEAQQLLVSMLTKAANPTGRPVQAASASGVAAMDADTLASTLKAIIGRAQNN